MWGWPQHMDRQAYQKTSKSFEIYSEKSQGFNCSFCIWIAKGGRKSQHTTGWFIVSKVGTLL